MIKVNIGTVYSFSTASAVLLGATVTRARLTGIVDYQTALLYRNIPLDFKAIAPTIVGLSPTIRPSMCTYYIFMLTSGERLVLADVWIDASTVTRVDTLSATIVLPDVSQVILDEITRLMHSFNIEFHLSV